MAISKRMLFSLNITVFFALFFQCSVTHAGSYPTPEEVQYLPPYCQARLSDKVSRAKKALWRKRIGKEVWTGFHHYCQQINYVNRYYKTTNPEVKNKLLNQIIKGMQGQLKAYGPGFVLKHDAYYRMGWAQKTLGKNAEAIKSFEMAIKTKPKYTKAYAALSDSYKDLGQFKKALDVINKGIKKSPKSKSLKKKKLKLEKKLKK